MDMKSIFKYCAAALVAALAISCSKSEGGKGYEAYALIVTQTKNYVSIPKDAQGHSTNPKLENIYRDLNADMEKFFANRTSKWVVEYNTKEEEKTLSAKDEEAKQKQEALVSAYNTWFDKNYKAVLSDASNGSGTISIQYTVTLSRSQKTNIVAPTVLEASYKH